MPRSLNRFITGFLFLILVVLSLGPSAASQAWTDDPAVLTKPYVAFAGPGTYYTRDIAIRSAQEPLVFSTGTCTLKIEARVVAPYLGQWETLKTGGA